ncbi:TetR/AcrR family transcriptional regulator C-terminal domain-containing protein [Pyxidicoccus parkwayensis]|uniref:TetR/AcrR family transcriptional regulator C-terminal domain-containing protein n=1 Tax=Pyxidicoccus parkwayensis TaxID=2813578 RepID=A0ABX7P4D4_9BACT|nr:TetR/AcrR family transcriptional regulator C-terminal domain-containing protein [Pyxidicoccus parkwaysis]QSQ25292.1 TetR/AcrR family transcriptional regulator C-terminal domain-containing protein [Pyxidicoccus parkwaysis]
MRIQREQAVRAAWTLVDEIGVDGMTMRALAQALEIQAPSLYWHFPSKQVLLETMADALLEDVGREQDADAGWEAVVKGVAGELRRAFMSHRDGARVYAGTAVVSENTLRVSDLLIGALGRAALKPREASWAAFSVLDYVLGFTIEEQSLGAQKAEGPPVAERIRALAKGRFPHVAAAADAIVDPDFDARFAFGLELLVSGLRNRKPRR